VKGSDKLKVKLAGLRAKNKIKLRILYIQANTHNIIFWNINVVSIILYIILLYIGTD
jgi:hypothetical protein